MSENDVDVIAAPEIDITEGQEDGPLAFDAVVEIRPDGHRRRLREPAGHDPVARTRPTRRSTNRSSACARSSASSRPSSGPRPTATTSPSTSPARRTASRSTGLTADDYLYEVGSGRIVPELDEQLLGREAGRDPRVRSPLHPSDEDASPTSLPGPRQGGQGAKVLPELDDEFAGEASEFETLDELSDDLNQRMRQVKQVQAQMALREKVGEALAELVDDEIPEPLDQQRDAGAPAGPRHAAAGPGAHARAVARRHGPDPGGSARRAARDRDNGGQGRPGAACRRRGRGRSRPTRTIWPEKSRSRRSARARPGRGASRVRARRPDRRRYAPTSGSARRSTGWSRPSRSSTRTATRSTGPISRSTPRMTRPHPTPTIPTPTTPIRRRDVADDAATDERREDSE